MPLSSKPTLIVSPLAYERCFLVADIMAEVYTRPYTEYGLLGLADKREPLYVIATPLLTGQEVSSGRVFQSGYNVLQLGREIRILSDRLGRDLVPVCFIHRHPGACDMSVTDDQFMRTTFIDTASSILWFKKTRKIQVEDFDCNCLSLRNSQRHDVESEHGCRKSIEYSIGFSLIVNRERETGVTVAVKRYCLYCGVPSVRIEKAKLSIRPKQKLTPRQLRILRRSLEVEVEAKIELESQHTITER